VRLNEVRHPERGSARPLDGVRVLAVEQMQALPFATQLLAHQVLDVFIARSDCILDLYRLVKRHAHPTLPRHRNTSQAPHWPDQARMRSLQSTIVGKRHHDRIKTVERIDISSGVFGDDARSHFFDHIFKLRPPQRGDVLRRKLHSKTLERSAHGVNLRHVAQRHQTDERTHPRHNRHKPLTFELRECLTHRRATDVQLLCQLHLRQPASRRQHAFHDRFAQCRHHHAVTERVAGSVDLAHPRVIFAADGIERLARRLDDFFYQRAFRCRGY